MTWGLVWLTGAALLFFTNDRGETPLEKGLDRFPLARRRPGLVRILAVTGCLNLAYVVLFALPYNVISLHLDPVPPGYADHLVNGICGPGTGHACPSPHLPMELPGAPVPEP
jgi:hypothetical protein